jgi:5-methylcytosine-specific restriction enzyme A
LNALRSLKQLDSETVIKEDEVEYEKSINLTLYDENAGIEIVQKESKIRRLSRAIGDNLKLLYEYKCQICGENFSSKYDVIIAEVHHIDPFVTSLNNYVENQIIVCPNHHSVIHRSNPVFARKRLAYLYENGVVENIVLNKHL